MSSSKTTSILPPLVLCVAGGSLIYSPHLCPDCCVVPVNIDGDDNEEEEEHVADSLSSLQQPPVTALHLFCKTVRDSLRETRKKVMIGIFVVSLLLSCLGLVAIIVSKCSKYKPL